MSTNCETRSNAPASAPRTVRLLDPGGSVELTLPPKPAPRLRRAPGPPLRRCGVWASETLPSLQGARPAWVGTARAWSWSARVARPACRGSAGVAVSSTIHHGQTKLINSKLGLKLWEMGKEG